MNETILILFTLSVATSLTAIYQSLKTMAENKLLQRDIEQKYQLADNALTEALDIVNSLQPTVVKAEALATDISELKERVDYLIVNQRQRAR